MPAELKASLALAGVRQQKLPKDIAKPAPALTKSSSIAGTNAAKHRPAVGPGGELSHANTLVRRRHVPK